MRAIRLPAFTFLLCLLPALMPSPLQASTARDPYQYFFQQSLGDLLEELEIARDEGKQGIFVFFEMDECPFCHRMKQTVLNQPEVQEYFSERFHSLVIDIEGDIEMVDFTGADTTQKEFSRQNRVRATPLLVFYDLQGKPIFKYVGAPSGTQEFMWMGEFIADKVYLQKDDSGRNIRFARYKRMKKNGTL
ncbi:MAG: thioredoxin fold domain-containing protein [Gammaproteobacteria bacterium]|nr:thioredoxin fold domain-containing protein [Gammaproteobacteria bacterium]